MIRSNRLLGDRIRELREHAQLSREDLAVACGITEHDLERVEDGAYASLPQSLILKLADHLHPPSSFVLAHLLRLNKHPRVFKAFNVGLERTGTRSISSIFRHYHSRHEFMWSEAMRAIMDYERGIRSRDDFVSFVRERELSGMLELDSAGFNYFYLDILRTEYPSAKFIFTIRDCPSWLDSMLNLFINGVSEHPVIREYVSFLYGFDLDETQNALSRERGIEEIVEKLVRYWATANMRILTELPPDRSLMVQTSTISHRIPQMAGLVGVSPETMHVRGGHTNRTVRKHHPLRGIDSDFLSACMDEYASDLMSRFFTDMLKAGFSKITEPIL